MASLSSYYPQPLPIGTTSESVVVATGSSASRSLGDRFGEVFRVDDYGAKGDWNGTTGTDDTAAIQAAINAAVAAGGGVIRFGAGKKYRLVSMAGISNFTVGVTNIAAFAGHLFVGSGDYVSGFGSTTMNLMFDGQGATLHSDFYEPSKGSTLHFVCQFQRIIIRDLNFSKSQYLIPDEQNSSQTTAIRIFGIDANKSELFRVENCTFTNQFSAISAQVRDLAPNVAQSDCDGKLENFECIGCRFYYPYGSGRADGNWSSGLSGALAVMLATYVKSAVFDRCYMDGLVGGQLSAGYKEAMHGFLFPMPIKCKITNCYFKNCEVEVIKASDIETAQRCAIQGGFTQVPAWDGQEATKAASTISRAIVGNSINSTKQFKLVVGNVYCLYNNSTYDSNRGGFYVLNAKVGGGSYTFSDEEELSLTRVSSEPYQAVREISVGASFGSSVSLIDVDLLRECELIVSNTTFEGLPIKNSSGQFFSPERWDAPSILCDYSLIANGNSFIGGRSNIYSSASCGDFLPTIITNNSFYKYTVFNTQNTNRTAIFLRKSNAIISNNVFTIQNYLALAYVLFLGGHEIFVNGNYCVTLDPDGSNEFPWFVNYDFGGPWRIVSEDNYLRDLANYGNTADAGNVASYYGSIRGTTVRSGSQSIRLAKTFKSQDKSTWTVGVTNDGELEVIK
jgi:hypothetical protein